MFRWRAFTAGTGLALTYFAGFTSVFFSLSLWLQLGLGRTALAAGLTILPFAVGDLVGSSFSNVAARRLGPAVLQVGTAMAAVGFGGTLATIHLDGPAVPGVLLLPSLAFAGIGTGLTIAPNTNIVLARVPVRSAGAAGGMLSTAQRVGTAIGIAVVGVLLFGSLATGAPAAAASTVPALRRDLVATGMPAADLNRAVRHFTVCFDRRVSSADPSAPPPGCAGAGTGAGRDPAVSVAYAHAARTALADDFTSAMQVSMAFNLAAVVLAFLLVPFFPRSPAVPAGRAVISDDEAVDQLPG